jgi:membrane protein implicated in regulation of membrane protease activity
MEAFPAFGLLMLVGLAFPILLIFSALLFDLAVVVYVMITTRHNQRKRTRGTSLAGGRATVAHRRMVFNH